MRSNLIATLAGLIVLAGLGAAAVLPRLSGSGPAARASSGGVTIGGPFRSSTARAKR